MMVTGSIVLFKHTYLELRDLLQKLELSNVNPLFIVDNSPTDSIREIIESDHLNIQYIHQPSNPGFGAAHNIALKHAIEAGSEFHFVINPDVTIHQDATFSMVEFMKKDSNIGMLMPQILNRDGSIQYLPKLLPSPLSVFKRILNKKFGLYSSFVQKYELHHIDPNRIYDAPILSGCFTLIRILSLNKVGLYDDRFFMYFEDWDLSRRMQESYRTVYYPRVSVIHGYESGANKSPNLFRIFVRSYIRYFDKWGWFTDKKRYKVNRKTLNQFK
ncbi:glycosyltransferase [Sphingobacterium sp.]|uniref:glycosyltransferase n=1 Tax=Sphingobacterium sp. TaxID=341027 RepID=UPI002897E93B|nr:glycosyltransferase [Sphingobacterium sp.]